MKGKKLARGLKKVLCMAIVTVLVSTHVCMVLAEGTTEAATIGSGRAILELDKTKPADFDKYNTNVYGTSADDKDPFLLAEQNELLIYRADEKTANAWILDNFSTQVVAVDKKGSWMKSANLKNTSYSALDTGDLGNGSEFRYVQGIGYDPTGSGRKDHVAFIGYSPIRKAFFVEVKDLKKGTFYVTELTTAAWIESNGNPHPFEVENYLSITAGDYDDDNKDTLIVYAAGDKIAKIYEISISGYDLVVKEAIDLDDYLVYKDWKKTDDTKKKPVVSLTTGDFDGDGVDEFAYSAGFYNASASAEAGWNGQFGDSMKHFASYVQIVEYKAVSGTDENGQPKKPWAPGDPIWMFDRKDKVGQQDSRTTYLFTVMHAASVTAADTDGDGADEIVACGYKSDPKVDYINGKWDTVYNVCDWDQKNYAVSVISHNSGNSYQKSDIIALGMSDFYIKQFGGTKTDTGYNDKRFVFPKISLAAGKVNGDKAAEIVFVDGVLYSFESGTAQNVFTPNIMTETFTTVMNSQTNSSEVMYVGSVAVGNFDNNDAGREQFAYTLWFMESGDHKNNFAYLDIIGGVEYEDEYKDGELVNYGTVKTYGQTYMRDGSDNNFWSDAEKSSKLTGNTRQSAVAVPVTVDVDDDGLLAKFEGTYYAYSDPEVLAVLQAAPYYEELDNVGATSFTLTNGYGISHSKGWEIGFGVGVAAEFQITHFKVGFEVGTTHSFSKNYTDSYTVSQSSTIEASDKSVVVITRIPVMIYNYLIQNPTTKQWTERFTVSVPLTPTLFSLTIDEYNGFVDTYNNAIKDGVKLRKINDVEAGEPLDLPLDHEGDPYQYWNNWNDCGGKKLSRDTYRLDKSNTTTESEWESETEFEEEYSHSHGMHFGLTIQGGIGDGSTGGALEVWVGAYAELDVNWTFGITKTTFSGVTVAGEVQNITTDDGDYEFYWDFGTWGRKLTDEKDAPDVPFYGYRVDRQKAPAKPVEDLKAEFDTNEDGEMVVVLTWKDGGTAERPTGSFVVYQYQDNGSAVPVKEISTNDAAYVITNEKGERVYRYVFDAIDGRSVYQFAVNAKGNGTSTTVTETASKSTVYAYVETKAIYAIEFTGSNGLTDTYTISYTDGTVSYLYVKNGVGITSFEKTGTNGLEDTYKITYSDGSSKTITVMNGKDGEKGEKGETGAQGEKGEKGETGAQGEKGEKGETGAQGEKGDKGDKGEPGRNGADGRDGKDGLNGKDGADGKDGLIGKDGIDGKNGADGKDGLNGKDGKDGVDGVGVTNVTIMDGNLIITLSDGKVINAGRIPVENHVTIPSGDAKSFYFNTSGSDITKVTINGREIEKGSYEVETYGEGALVTIEEETIPLSGAEIKVETKTGTETVKVQPQNNSNNNSKNSNNNTGNSVPWWVIYILIGLNVLTGGVAVLALAKKNK